MNEGIDVLTTYHIPHPDTDGYRVVISTTYKTQSPEVWTRMADEARNTIATGLKYTISDSKYRGMDKRRGEGEV